MSFFVYHRLGESESDPPLASFPALLDELEECVEDEEHLSVSLVHESEWALGFHRGGYVCFENVAADDEPRHLDGVSRERLLALMAALARGDLETVEREPWRPGY
ncbi:MAG TPA: hypothetical protein VEW25_05135 [Allosphingosinicella sp.]|nr:hypothetical protein [Allosphingosinicella sp.]